MEDNRIALALHEFAEQSQRMQVIFGQSIIQHRTFNQARLAHYRSVRSMTLPAITNEEKLMRFLMKGEIERMEQELYPSRFVRIGRWIARITVHILKRKAMEPQRIKEIRKFNKDPLKLIQVTRKEKPVMPSQKHKSTVTLLEKNVPPRETPLIKKNRKKSTVIKR